MCGRYSQSQTPAKIMERFGIKGPAPKKMKARYNIAPSQEAPVVIREEENKIELFRWGLIPSWAKDPSIGNRMINARAETVQTKPSFRKSFKRYRCLVPADSFYEWKLNPDGKTKTPMRIRLKSEEPFALAGLWDHWQDKDGKDKKEIRTFTIITTAANKTLAPIHERMPVILKPEDEEAWLNPETEPKKLLKMLGPYPSDPLADPLADPLEAYAISKIVNSPRNDTIECFEPA